MTAPQLDVRQRRTRAALHRAVLELAAEQRPGDITMTALAARARVHRSTVYQHGASAVDLLRTALAEQLDALREEHLVGVPPEGLQAALRDVTLGVFAHVEEHAAVYRSLRASTGISLHGFLGTHFHDSMRMLMARSGLVAPVDVDGLPRELTQEAAARFVADGVVGLIDAWLDDPSPHDPAMMLDLFTRLAPPWWPFRADVREG